MEIIEEQKWRWAGHGARRAYNRWSKRLTVPDQKGGAEMRLKVMEAELGRDRHIPVTHVKSWGGLYLTVDL